MSNLFHVGQKVVLIDDSERNNQHGVDRSIGIAVGAQYPVKGRVYTVREVFQSHSGCLALLLAELDNSKPSRRLGANREVGFEADRFRPVVERKTDISVFTALLNTQRVGVDA